MNITINGKTYVSKPIKMSATREALKIYEESLELLDKQATLKIEDADTQSQIETARQVSALLQKTGEIQERKCELLVRLYDNQFTLNELYDNLTSAELDVEFNKIMLVVNGTIGKNA